MTDEEFLKSKGWERWYSETHWVHPKTVSDPTRQDYTNYQCTTKEAIEIEKTGKQFEYYGDIGAALKTYVEMQRKRK